jgi:predicted NAD/FAD-dependent oxidoreductase
MKLSGTRPLSGNLPSVAVIGAGISGLFVARTLRDSGFPVTVFDKGRGVGGRMATRRTDDGLRFDHGAQYFTVRDKRFARHVQSWLAHEIVARWNGRIGIINNGKISRSERNHDRYVGIPAMNSVCKHLARDVTVHTGTRVFKLTRFGALWTLHDENGTQLGDFDWTIVTPPAPQAAELLAEAVPHLATKAAAVEMQPCWALMIEFADPLSLPLDGAVVHESPLAWVARNSSKPDREGESDCWVLHASPEWSEKHIEADKNEIASLLLSEFWRATRLTEVKPKYRCAHRWRFAIPHEPLTDRCLHDPQLNIAVCGDWCSGPRVEGAFLSGMSAADTLLRLVASTSTSSQQLSMFDC